MTTILAIFDRPSFEALAHGAAWGWVVSVDPAIPAWKFWTVEALLIIAVVALLKAAAVTGDEEES